MKAIITAAMLFIFASAAFADDNVTSSDNLTDEDIFILDDVNVTGQTERRVIGNTSGASQEVIERRNASHMSDIIDQISGTSVNSLYSRPEVSVGVQGIAGHGRVSQSLEGINQNFHAFTKDIGQTGSIFVEPQFLKSIEVSRGGNTGTGTLGSLGGSVDFQYLDVNDILDPDENFGGMVRLSTGFSEYANGQELSGSVFLAGRTKRWEVMLGVSDAENESYKIGSNFDHSDMLKYFHANNIKFYDGINDIVPTECRYSGIIGIDSTSAGRSGFANCQLTEEQLKALKQAAKSGKLLGTEKETDSQMLRVRHYFNDSYDQSIELFATASHAKYQTDQQPSILTPLDGSDASWNGQPWHVKTELDSEVISLKYSGAFNELFNPEVHIYHESQERKQRWVGLPGSSAANENLHYFVDIASTGVKLNNASYFNAPLFGALRFDVGVEYRRAEKEVDSLTEEQLHQQQLKEQGRDYVTMVWDPESRNDTTGLALALSTDGNTPWQASVGAGYQHVSMDIYSPMFSSGNLAKGGILPAWQPLRDYYRSLGYSATVARQMAQAEVAELFQQMKIDPDSGYVRWVSDDQKHRYDLKSYNFALQYTKPNTGLTTYGSLGYSERAPTSNEMYISGAWLRQLFVANPDLEPEENLSVQLGVKYNRSALLTSSDELNANVGFYRNRIKNYIGYGPIWMANDVIANGVGQAGGAVANVNNLEDVIRSGFEFNLSYSQPLFYVQGNLTAPIRHDNKMCSWQSPSGKGYYLTFDEDGSSVFTQMTDKGEKLCYSGWNWMETSLIEPIRGNLTVAVTPMDGKLELGSTVHYKRKQRAAYYYVKDAQKGTNAENGSSETLPDKDDWLVAYLWPEVLKFDLFASYRFNENLKLGVYFANITDVMEATTTTYGYNFYPGRTLTANLEYKF